MDPRAFILIQPSKLACHLSLTPLDIFFYKPWRPKFFLLNLNDHKCLRYLFPFHSNTCVIGLRPL